MVKMSERIYFKNRKEMIAYLIKEKRVKHYHKMSKKFRDEVRKSQLPAIALIGCNYWAVIP